MHTQQHIPRIIWSRIPLALPWWHSARQGDGVPETPRADASGMSPQVRSPPLSRGPPAPDRSLAPAQPDRHTLSLPTPSAALRSPRRRRGVPHRPPQRRPRRARRSARPSKPWTSRATSSWPAPCCRVVRPSWPAPPIPAAAHERAHPWPRAPRRMRQPPRPAQAASPPARAAAPTRHRDAKPSCLPRRSAARASFAPARAGACP